MGRAVTRPEDSPPMPTVGAGLIARSGAVVVARAGFSLRLTDLDPGAFAAALAPPP